MRADDLVPILAQKPPSGVGMRQGVIVTWNQLTGNNTVLVGGTLLTDLPFQVSTEVQLLAPGDVVTLLTFGNTWCIQGRIAYPGTAAAVSAIKSITNRIQASSDATQGTSNVATFGDLVGTDVGPAVTVDVGPSGRVLAFWSCDSGETGTWQELVNATTSVAVSGATTRAASLTYGLAFNLQLPPAGSTGEALSAVYSQSSLMHLFTGLNEGTTTFTMKYSAGPAVARPNNPIRFRQRELAVFVL